MNKNSDITTNGIRIQVFPQYMPEESAPQANKYFFLYRIVITNVGTEWCKLLSRHWIIINSEGDKEEVVGDGVVGYLPELSPGMSFDYESYCPLNTPWGTMEGKYFFMKKDGSKFESEIARFYLFAPEAVNV